MKKKLMIIIYLICILGITIFISLDTFVISRVYKKVELQENSTKEITKKIVSENKYQDENIEVNILTVRKYDTDIYIADIVINNPDYIRTKFANDAYGKNIKQTTSDMAASVNAIIAVNGDYYGSREKGYVIRNGILYRDAAYDNREDLVITKGGNFEIINEGEISAKTLLENYAKEVFSFGPGLVKNGEISIDKDFEVDQATTSNPRTAIGQISDNHYIFIVSDGRISESKGLSVYELATIMKEYGVITGYNLDGGGSSTMVFMGKVINNPVNHGSKVSERKVSDIVYIGY